jgi:hypothetical protein
MGRTSTTLLDRTSTWLKNRWTVVGLVIAAIAIVESGNIAEAIGKIANLVEPCDLDVSPLAEQGLERLDGHPDPKPEASGRLVYLGGAKVAFSLAHNQRSEATIGIRRMSLVVLRHETKLEPVFTATLDAATHPGALVQPHIFLLQLAGGKPVFASWTPSSGSEEPRVADPANLLETKPPFDIRLTKKDDVESFRGTIVATDRALYEVAFEFDYLVGAHHRTRRSQSFLIAGVGL